MVEGPAVELLIKKQIINTTKIIISKMEIFVETEGRQRHPHLSSDVILAIIDEIAIGLDPVMTTTGDEFRTALKDYAGVLKTYEDALSTVGMYVNKGL